MEERNSPNLISLTARLLKAVVRALLTTTPSFAVTFYINSTIEMKFVVTQGSLEDTETIPNKNCYAKAQSQKGLSTWVVS